MHSNYVHVEQFSFRCRTNLPYQLMEFPDHLYPDGTDSYPASNVVFKFMHSFVTRFGLREHIKLNHLVIRCLPIENDQWAVIVKDLPNDRFETINFDAVIVCNGHYVTPRISKMPGQNLFKGRVLHSHDYRKPEVKVILFFRTFSSARVRN